jgi:hypothetical protein
MQAFAEAKDRSHLSLGGRVTTHGHAGTEGGRAADIGGVQVPLEKFAAE